jgi:hypothetical protein
VASVTCSYCYLPVNDASLWIDSEITSRPISAGLLLIIRRPETRSRTYYQLHKHASENCEHKGDRKGAIRVYPGMNTFCLNDLLTVHRGISVQLNQREAHFVFSLLRINGRYMFRAVLTHFQEVLHKNALCYVCWLHQDSTPILVQPTDITRTQYTK